jgi:hypothetical protein
MIIKKDEEGHEWVRKDSLLYFIKKKKKKIGYDDITSANCLMELEKELQKEN